MQKAKVVSCLTKIICLEDSSKYAEASELYADEIQFVSQSVGEIQQPPRVIFCTMEACFQSFGFDKSAGNTIGTAAIVLSPRAWTPYHLRHEMIHHLQNERLGNFKVWLVTPSWFSEEMAYSLSQDPRPTLAGPWQHYRSQFESWYQQVGKERLWEEAAKL